MIADSRVSGRFLSDVQPAPGVIYSTGTPGATESALARIATGATIDLAELDYLCDQIAYIRQPRILLAAWRAGVLTAETLVAALPWVWMTSGSPNQALTADEWRELFNATGFIGTEPPRERVLYRGSAVGYRDNWCWTSDPASAMLIGDLHHHHPIMWTAVVPPQEQKLQLMASEFAVVDTGHIHIRAARADVLHRARFGNSVESARLAARAAGRANIATPAAGGEQVDCDLIDYHRGLGNFRWLCDAAGMDTPTFAQCTTVYPIYCRVRDALRGQMKTYPTIGAWHGI